MRRGDELFRGSMLVAYRTVAIDGQPAEIWTLRDTYRDDPTFVSMLADAADFIRLHRWQSLPALVEYDNDAMVVIAPPWVGLGVLVARAGGRLPAELVLSLVRDLAREIAMVPPVALRSLSPTTIAVTTWGRPRLLDLSLAKFPERRGHATMSGVIKGEIAFMSPENALGRKLDHRSDIFSLGMIAYELLTGVRAVNRSTEIDRLIQIRDAAIDFDVLRDAQPAEVAMLVERMLVRSRGNRIGARELADAIERSEWSWSSTQMFEAARRIAPEEFDTAILYGI